MNPYINPVNWLFRGMENLSSQNNIAEDLSVRTQAQSTEIKKEPSNVAFSVKQEKAVSLVSAGTNNPDKPHVCVWCGKCFKRKERFNFDLCE